MKNKIRISITVFTIICAMFCASYVHSDERQADEQLEITIPYARQAILLNLTAKTMRFADQDKTRVFPFTRFEKKDDEHMIIEIEHEYTMKILNIDKIVNQKMTFTLTGTNGFMVLQILGTGIKTPIQTPVQARKINLQ
ncbi:hypothetical protein [Desulfonema limicola]|nr:hypothetical protein [Desulfonema limicola]